MTPRQQLLLMTLRLGALAAIAYFLASGTSTLLASQLRESLDRNSSNSRDQRARRQGRSHRGRSTLALTEGDPILDRNIFDSVTGPISSDESQLDEDWTDESTEEKDIVACSQAGDVKVTLEATVADPDRPGWSFASVGEGKDSRLVRIGDFIDGRTVKDITWRYLLLEGSDDSCYLDLFNKEKPKKRVFKRGKGKHLSRKDLRRAVKKVGPYKRVVDRAVFDRALANPTRFMRGIRVRTSKRRGEVEGFRLRRVRKRSVFEALGAKVGDVVHSVNGKPLNSVESALAAYQELKSASSFTFDITRKGKPISLEVALR